LEKVLNYVLALLFAIGMFLFVQGIWTETLDVVEKILVSVMLVVIALRLMLGVIVYGLRYFTKKNY
jgi:hypothetical protein